MSATIIRFPREPSSPAPKKPRRYLRDDVFLRGHTALLVIADRIGDWPQESREPVREICRALRVRDATAEQLAAALERAASVVHNRVQLIDFINGLTITGRN